MSGLIGCIYTEWNMGFCTQKSLEMICSSSLLVLMTTQLVLSIKQSGIVFKLRYLIMLQIILSLLTNCIYCFLHRHKIFYDIETFFFNLYYVSIVLYVTTKFFKKISQNRAIFMKVAYAIYSIFVFLYLSILIESILIHVNINCEQLWFVIVRILGLLLSIVLMIFGLLNQDVENQRLLSYVSVKSIYNPLPKLWCWIIWNAIMQLIDIIESLVFVFDKKLDCRFNSNPNINYAITFIMLLLTFELPYASTLYIFWKPICQKQQKYFQRDESIYEETTGGIEITFQKKMDINQIYDKEVEISSIG